jgi:hypothetical protein
MPNGGVILMPRRVYPLSSQKCPQTGQSQKAPTLLLPLRVGTTTREMGGGFSVDEGDVVIFRSLFYAPFKGVRY